MMRSVKSIHAEIPADEGRTPHPHSLSVANFPISLGDHHSTLATTHPVEWTGVPGPKSLETIFSPVTVPGRRHRAHKLPWLLRDKNFPDNTLYGWPLLDRLNWDDLPAFPSRSDEFLRIERASE